MSMYSLPTTYQRQCTWMASTTYLLLTTYYLPTYRKALLLTFVVTATSRLPIKGSKASQTF